MNETSMSHECALRLPISSIVHISIAPVSVLFWEYIYIINQKEQPCNIALFYTSFHIKKKTLTKHENYFPLFLFILYF